MVKLFLKPFIILKLVSFLWDFVFICTLIYANLCTAIKTIGVYWGNNCFWKAQKFGIAVNISWENREMSRLCQVSRQKKASNGKELDMKKKILKNH